MSIGCFIQTLPYPPRFRLYYLFYLKIELLQGHFCLPQGTMFDAEHLAKVSTTSEVQGKQYHSSRPLHCRSGCIIQCCTCSNRFKFCASM